MIKDFRCKETQRVFERRDSKRFSNIQRTALRKLLVLEAARSMKDLRVPPANRLEKLSGQRRSQFSIRVNDQWRICFRWRDGDAHEVEIVGYAASQRSLRILLAESLSQAFPYPYAFAFASPKFRFRTVGRPGMRGRVRRRVRVR